jgi:hypothetical protein
MFVVGDIIETCSVYWIIQENRKISLWNPKPVRPKTAGMYISIVPLLFQVYYIIQKNFLIFTVSQRSLKMLRLAAEKRLSQMKKVKVVVKRLSAGEIKKATALPNPYVLLKRIV